MARNSRSSAEAAAANGRAMPASIIDGAAAAGIGICQPAGISTGWITRCVSPPSVTTRSSTATHAVNRHSTPNRSEVATMRRSSSASPPYGLLT